MAKRTIWRVEEGDVYEKFSVLDGSCGLIYVKGGKHLKVNNFLDRPSILFPRCHSKIGVHSQLLKMELILDIYSFLILPAYCDFLIFGTDLVGHYAQLLPSEDLINKTAHVYGLDGNQIQGILCTYQSAKRSNWQNEVMHRYVYERVGTKQNNNIAIQFLEQELLKEVYFATKEKSLAHRGGFNLDSVGLNKKSSLCQKALDYIERNLFGEISVARLISQVGASESTLLRRFKNEMGMSPFEYMRERRLEEASILLKSNKFNVSEVSDLVGYNSSGAFIAAFKAKYGFTPTCLRG